MPGFSVTGAVSFGSGVQFSTDPGPISAIAGSTTTALGSTVTAITSFFPFSLVQNGTPPYTYFVSAGVLPTGITINSNTGLVAGVPLAGQTLGNVTFTVRDINNVLASTTSAVGFTTFAVTTGASSVIATVNTAITAFNPLTITSGGTAPYTYFISSGTLPTGIQFNTSTGQVSGTPTVLQSASSVVFGASDANNVIIPTTVSVSFAVNATYSVNVALVGGGGGGGQKAPFPTNTFYNAGGGGGGGGVLQQTVTFGIGQTYSIVVGGGGTKGGGDPVNGGTLANGGNGTPSTLSGPPTFNTLTAGGGGGGASATGPGSPNTASGTTGSNGVGSPSPTSVQGAGGGGAAILGLPLTIAVGISGGAPGGTGVFSGGSGSASRYSGPTAPQKGYIGAGGGGGGAGGGGSSGSPPGSPTTCFGPTSGIASKGGNGGPGATVPFVPNVYGGGGGGAAGLGGNFPTSGPNQYAGLGGPGGGGQGRPGYPNGSVTAGDTNTGGGGGGNSSDAGSAGNGGSGVVIIAIPTPNYPSVVATGAIVSNPPAAPGQTVLTFNNSGNITA